ncbi:MAG: glycosyltransferase family 4 protein [Acidimicrobiales bacterium]
MTQLRGEEGLAMTTGVQAAPVLAGTGEPGLFPTGLRQVERGNAFEPWGGGGRPAPGSALDAAMDAADRAGLKRIHILAWRDLEDPEAGGSELHAHRIATLWAAAGLDVTLRTSSAAGRPAIASRSGYKVVRKAGRYAVFPRSILSGLAGRSGRRDGLVEIWNGMPFLSPVWARCPKVVFLHHVHAEMWQMALPAELARVGRMIEQRLAPPLYRKSRIVTLSKSSRNEIIEMLGMAGSRVTVVPPGVEERFSPGGPIADDPLVVAVGRLVPVKRFDLLIDALVSLREKVPRLRAVIVGEGYERPRLEARRSKLGADEWISLPGRLADDDLVDLYRQAWVLASMSQREGWGMTITEAGSCGTPAVATRIAGHIDAVDEGRSGILVDSVDEMAAALAAIVEDPVLRARLGRGAIDHASRFTWGATAAGTLSVLAGEAIRAIGG